MAEAVSKPTTISKWAYDEQFVPSVCLGSRLTVSAEHQRVEARDPGLVFCVVSFAVGPAVTRTIPCRWEAVPTPIIQHGLRLRGGLHLVRKVIGETVGEARWLRLGYGHWIQTRIRF